MSKTIKFIMPVYSSDDYESVNVATVSVGADLLEAILARKESFCAAKEAESSLYSMRYWCGEPEFFESEYETDEADLAPDDFSGEGVRTECMTMIVTEGGVHWTCYRKHCSNELRSDELSYDFLKESLL